MTEISPEYKGFFTAYEDESEEESSPLVNHSDDERDEPSDENDAELALPMKIESSKYAEAEKNRKARNQFVADAIVGLFRLGAASIPIYNDATVKEKRAQLLDEAYHFPEYKDPSNKKTQYVLGGFGALGNPASFHNDAVRTNRLNMMENARPLFQALVQVWEELANGDFGSISNERADTLIGRKLSKEEKIELRKGATKIIKRTKKYAKKHPGSQWLLEQVVDRMMVRKAGNVFKGEDWHQDVSPFLKTNTPDLIFGGWVGFNPKLTERFTFSAGSHSFGDFPYELGKEGFAKLAKIADDHPEEYKIRTETLETTIQVPPGSWCVFPQNLVHLVNPSDKQDFDIVRQFFGFRLVFGPLGKIRSIHDHVELQKKPEIEFKLRDALQKQGPFPQPSGEVSRMYPRQLGSTGLYKTLIPWSEKTFLPVCLETKIIQPRTGDISKEVKAKLPKKGKRIDTKSAEYKEAKEKADALAEKQAIEQKLPPAGSKYKVVQVWMKSLEELKLPKYAKYDPLEISILEPLPLFKEGKTEKKQEGKKRPRSPRSIAQEPASKKPKVEEQKEEITPSPKQQKPGFIDLTKPRQQSVPMEQDDEDINIMT